MAEFFKGWRLKVGLTTLVIACALMGIWVRSHVVVDDFVVEDSNGRFVFAFEGGRAIGTRLSESLFSSEAGILEPIGGGLEWGTRPYKKEVSDPYEYQARCGWAGIEFSNAKLELVSAYPGNHRMASSLARTSIAVSLLWMILPLTLFSARLILWKPGKNL